MTMGDVTVDEDVVGTGADGTGGTAGADVTGGGAKRGVVSRETAVGSCKLSGVVVDEVVVVAEVVEEDVIPVVGWFVGSCWVGSLG